MRCIRLKITNNKTHAFGDKYKTYLSQYIYLMISKISIEIREDSPVLETIFDMPCYPGQVVSTDLGIITLKKPVNLVVSKFNALNVKHIEKYPESVYFYVGFYYRDTYIPCMIIPVFKHVFEASDFNTFIDDVLDVYLDCCVETVKHVNSLVYKHNPFDDTITYTEGVRNIKLLFKVGE